MSESSEDESTIDIETEEAFMRYFLQSERKIFGFIVALVPNFADAEDLLQETCSIMWRKFDQFEVGTNFSAWGITIARYRVLNYRRNSASRKVLFSEDLMQRIADATVDIASSSDSRLAALQSCMTQLRDKDKELIRLRYFSENSTKQTADQLGRSVDAIYKALNRVHDSLLCCIRRSLIAEGGME